MKRTAVILAFTATFLISQGQTEDLPEESQVVAAMTKAARFFHEKLSVQGGYASQWPKDLSEGRTEHGASPTIISIQPPGTTTVGRSLLRAYRATGESLFLEMAKEAANSLVLSQLASGGWPSDFDFDPEKQKRYHLRSDLLKGETDPGKKRDYSTLDDNKTQSAMLFLTELVNTPGVEVGDTVTSALDFALEKLISVQAPIGAWPQQFSSATDLSDAPVIPVSMPDSYPRKHPKENYVHFYTLNDNNLENVVKLLIRTHQLTGDVAALDSAKRCGSFLLLAQHTGTQRGWSQQYNLEMVPVWARKFEPPSLSSAESLGAIETLFELWVATGETRFIETLPDALEWLEKSQLPDGHWARFYELKTNRPLYCEADTYQLTYDDSNTPTHYAFKISPGLKDKIDRLRKELARPRESIIESRTRPYAPAEWSRRAKSSRGKVKAAMTDQSKEGYWLSKNTIDANLFSKHINAMADYVEALRKSKLEAPSLRN